MTAFARFNPCRWFGRNTEPPRTKPRFSCTAPTVAAAVTTNINIEAERPHGSAESPVPSLRKALREDFAAQKRNTPAPRVHSKVPPPARFTTRQARALLHQSGSRLAPRSDRRRVALARRRQLKKSLRGGGTNATPTQHGTDQLREQVHAPAISQSQVQRITDAEDEAFELCPYAISAADAKLLAAFGIPTPHIGTQSHEHPVHKVIENFLFNRALRGHQGKDAFTVFWMKDFKAKKLGANAVANPVLSVRDTTRYRSFEYSGMLPGAIPTATLVLADVGHFLTPDDYAFLFHQYHNLERILVTAIVPPETLDQRPSLYPDLYQLDYDTAPGSVLYSLEGHAGDHYEQPLSGNWILSANRVGAHSVERLLSVYAHHLYQITRGTAPVKKTVDSFTVPEGVVIPNGVNSDLPEFERCVPAALHKEAHRHAIHLNKLGFNDVLAKIRAVAPRGRDWFTETAFRHVARFELAARPIAREADLEIETCGPWVQKWRKFKRSFRSKVRRGFITAQLASLWVAFTGSGLAAWLYTPVHALAAFVPTNWPFLVTVTVAAAMITAVEVVYFTTSDPYQRYADLERAISVKPMRITTQLRHYPAKSRLSALRRMGGSGLAAVRELRDVHHEEIPPSYAGVTEFDRATSGRLPRAAVKPSAAPSRPAPPSRSRSTLSIASDASDESESPEMMMAREEIEDKQGYEPETTSGEQAPAELERVIGSIPDLLGISEDRVHPAFEHWTLRGNSEKAPLPTRMLCLFKAVRDHTGMSIAQQWDQLAEMFHRESILTERELQHGWTTHGALVALCLLNNWQFQVRPPKGRQAFSVGMLQGEYKGLIAMRPGHFINVEDDGPKTGETSEAPPVERGGEYEQFKRDLLAFRTEDGTAIATKGIKRHTVPIGGSAKAYASDLKNEYTGQLYSSLEYRKRKVAKSLDSTMDAYSGDRVVDIIVLLGYNGSGKTYALQQFLIKYPKYQNLVKVSVPSNTLRDDWIKDLKPRSTWWISTFEMSAGQSRPVWIVDEFPRNVAGYIDLGLMETRNVKMVIALGDVTQLGPVKKNKRPGAECKWHREQSELDAFRKYADYYYLFTRRTPENLSQLWKVKSYNTKKGKLGASVMPVPGEMAVTTNAENDLNLLDPNAESMLTQVMQGRTVKKTLNISLDTFFVKHADKHMMVMLTNRSTVGLHFYGALSGKDKRVLKKNTVVSEFLAKRPQDVRQLFKEELRGLTIIEAPYRPEADELRGGATRTRTARRAAQRRAAAERGEGKTETQRRRERRTNQHRVTNLKNLADEATAQLHSTVHDDEWVPAYTRVGLSHIREELPREEPPPEQAAPEYKVRTHYPAPPLEEIIRNEIVNLDRNAREQYIDGHLTMQFDDDNDDIDVPDGRAFRESIARHRAKDPRLMKLSQKTRLPRATAEEKRREILKKKVLGRMLFAAYQMGRGYPTEGPVFDEIRYARSIEINDWNKLHKKTRAFIQASAAKSDPDWRFTFTRIFLKIQEKASTWDAEQVKKAQTIANMNDQYLLFMGPCMRYMFEWDCEHCPSDVFILGGKTPEQMDRFAKEHFHGEEYTDNDYTAFDQSQGAEALEFELLRMSWFGIPEHITEVYFKVKTRMHHQFWESAIMRYSGEPNTYKDNTAMAEACSMLMYGPALRARPRMFSGDDSLFLGFLQPTAQWKSIEHLMTLKAKTNHARIGSFCGYLLSHLGALRDPFVLAHKLLIAAEAGKLSAVLVSFTREYLTGHAIGDAIFGWLPERTLECHFAVGNYLYQHGDAVVRSMFTSRPIDDLADLPLYQQLQQFSTDMICKLTQRVRVQAYKAALALRGEH